MTDSYLKLAQNVFPYGWGKEREFFDCVHFKDREEVAVAFALFVIDDLNYYADTFRITPTNWYCTLNRKEHDNKASCCGYADSVVKCKSGRFYFIGYNYGH